MPASALGQQPLPGLTATAVAAEDPVQPLRTDVACFAGRTRRGPVATPVRVTDWAAFDAVFGGLDGALDLPYAVRGFFANGGTALWVLRAETAERAAASADWPAGAPSPFAPVAGCRVVAASEGGWADGTRVTVRHRPAGSGGPQALLRVDAPGEPPESYGWLPLGALPDAVAAGSRLIRLVPHGPTPTGPAAGPHAATWTGRAPNPPPTTGPAPDPRPPTTPTGPAADPHPPTTPTGPAPDSPPLTTPTEPAADPHRAITSTGRAPAARSATGRAGPAGPAAGVRTAVLAGGRPSPGAPDADGTLADGYADAVRAMGRLPEPALLALPDLDRCGVGAARRDELADLLVRECAAALDRLALLDPPLADGRDPVAATARAVAWLADLRERHDTAGLQACAVHWPPLRVPDPLAVVPPALRTVPASGHVAGLAARLDRERGAFATPANALLEDVVDLAQVLRPEQEAAVYASGANLLRCPPGRGPLVWGGRTAVPQERAEGVGKGWFIAHRRLLHRLVRAAHAVAEPLLFEPDTPGLRLLLVQGLTEVLLGMFEAGALAGERPAEAFRVRCDEGLNPAERTALGQVVCQVEVAPAAPMEFIAIRLVLGGRDRLEVVEP
ncbi:MULTISPECIES: phage tail sheath subtilisin-like domain-containing protein [Streptomyces]|uniref:Phage tail sheath subtilisin-like domain-containing protein n=2 Tax=Streptomyces TaxID=1883 RepID=A0ABV9IL95_9ACTN